MVYTVGVDEAVPVGSGAVVVRPTEFARIDSACAEFLRVIARIRALAREIGDQEHWGLGERHARLISGCTLVARLRSVAAANENSVAAVLDTHAEIVGDIQQSFRAARDLMTVVDDQWADRLRMSETSAGQHIYPVSA
ncbi:hypothetical protein [Nocardia alba]|uniref:Excreted virulence factor EspC (Type VII ESX diderm) n=1 Tax=Nocardia alba TaxID=225051 RepID=A0A4R1FMZ2_9NOCA|nr:hypothetical protein [Nocardia alba]TCJ93618.1 hypothetical protein DFR71_5468 [Nocardia alba]